MLYNRAIYDLAGIVKLVADKIGPADRFMILALLKNINDYLERFETTEGVSYDDPVITIKNLCHTIEDINAVKQPIQKASHLTKAPPKTIKTPKPELPVPVHVPVHIPVDNANPSPYKQPRTLFSSPSEPARSHPPLSRLIAGKKPPPPPDSESDDGGGGGDYPDDYSDDDSNRSEQVVEEEIVEEPIDMLERALSAIANETSKSSYTVDMTGSETTSKVSVTKKKKRGKLTGKGKLAVFTPKPFLAPDQEYVNPTPRMYSSTYGGTKWPENQPFVCEYCRQINPNAKQYKVHLRHKHKDESPCCCKYCKAEFGNTALFNFHRCSKRHQCNVCYRFFPRPYKLKKHMATHNKMYMYRTACVTCEQQYTTAKECALHLFNDHELLVYCDTCMDDFDPTGCEISEPDRIYCRKCAEEAPDSNAPVLGLMINPNSDMIIHKKRVNSQKFVAVTKPAGMPDKPKRNYTKNEYCEVCEKTYSHGLVSHEKSLKHKRRQAIVEGVECAVFKCQVHTCGKEFASEPLLQRHHDNMHMGKVNHECKICGKQFYLQNSFRSHMMRHMGARNFKCEECGKAFGSNSTLKDHKVSMHRDKFGVDLKCPHCDMTFYSRKLRGRHVATFHMNYIYRCTDCDFSTLNPHAITSHVKKNHPGNIHRPLHYRHIADTAPKLPPAATPGIPGEPGTPAVGDPSTPADPSAPATPGLSTMSVGMRIRHEDFVFPRQCKACNETVDSVEDFSHHLNNSETHKAKISEMGWFSRTNPCAHCDVEFPTSSALDEHTWVHHLDSKGMPMFKCSRCTQIFQKVTSFRKHIDDRAKCERNLIECKECGQAFPNRNALTIHWTKEHNEIVLPECEICKKKFETKAHLTQHKNINHFYYIFACTVCDYASKESIYLRRHIQEHHKDVLYTKARDYRKRADGNHVEPPPPAPPKKKMVVTRDELEAFHSLQDLKLTGAKRTRKTIPTVKPAEEDGVSVFMDSLTADSMDNPTADKSKSVDDEPIMSSEDEYNPLTSSDEDDMSDDLDDEPPAKKKAPTKFGKATASPVIKQERKIVAPGTSLTPKTITSTPRTITVLLSQAKKGESPSISIVKDPQKMKLVQPDNKGQTESYSAVKATPKTGASMLSGLGAAKAQSILKAKMAQASAELETSQIPLSSDEDEEAVAKARPPPKTYSRDKAKKDTAVKKSKTGVISVGGKVPVLKLKGLDLPPPDTNRSKRTVKKKQMMDL